MSKPMQKHSKVFVAGHGGLVGSALVRRLRQEGYDNLLLRRRDQLDLRNQAAVARFFREHKPEFVFLAAATVGGIVANDTRPAEFIDDNLIIQHNVLHSSMMSGVKRLLFLGSSCIYPKHCPQPMKEEYLLEGPLEPTNRPYAVAKIAGIEMCWAFNRQYGTKYVSVMPTNLYGPGDSYDLVGSHVIPAMIRKMHEAKQNGRREVVLWGTGTPRREFLYSDDLAGACLFLMDLNDLAFDSLLQGKQGPPIINIGCGEDLTILALAELIAEVVGFKGELVFDSSKPDGTPRKLLDVSRMRDLGWTAQTSLRAGLEAAYRDFKERNVREALEPALP
jgi:GDP-L-fucose synthase